MERERLVTMLEIALMAAVSVILSYVEFGALWAYGGSISLVMVPIFIMMFRRGWKAGVLTGALVGVIQLLTGGYVVHPVQLVLDYPLAYAVLGLGSVFAVRSVSSLSGIIIAISIGSLLRLGSHFLSGIIWFGDYAPEGIPVALYSILYNASYLVPEAAITIIVVWLLKKYNPQFFKASS